MYGLTILGNNSALPAFDRHPTAQALTWGDQVFLIDCGEGTQLQLNRYKVRRSKIHHIFISHLHGDHYFGLMGLITSMGLLGREAPLHIYGPAKLKSIIDLQLEAAGTVLKYPLHFRPNTLAETILNTEKFSVECFPVKHRVECWGYLFKEKKAPRKLLRDKAIEAGIPLTFYSRLQWGESYQTKTGEVIANETVTMAATPGLSYAYSADTIYDPSLVQYFRGVYMLYHEATFLHDLESRAADRYHATALQAAQIAGLANAHRLLIGHFSSKYEDLAPFLAEAITVFPETELAIEGITFRLLHRWG